jgi:indolepyruvate ferredoxin oxidoreductase, alpha subunit
MERSFAAEVKQLALGAGEVLRGEGILAITKALRQSGVSYVGGYPGAPVGEARRLVLADERGIDAVDTVLGGTRGVAAGRDGT